jgi:hypothetical protein
MAKSLTAEDTANEKRSPQSAQRTLRVGERCWSKGNS